MLSLLTAASTSSMIHSWFDPLQRWNYKPQSAPAPAARPLLAYIPGLDGGNGSPFVQFPGLGQTFEVRVQDVSFESRANEASFEAIVDDVAAFLRESGSSGHYVMGESFGGLVAAGVALRHPTLVAALVLVNPATAVSVMPDLQADVQWIRSGAVPDPLLPVALFAKVGRKTFDADFLITAVRDVLIDRKLEKLRTQEPELAAYYDTALNDFIGQLTAPKAAPFWRGRLAQLEQGCAFVEPHLSSLMQPTLVVAGTADELLASEREATRLSRLLPNCVVHRVEGAGHAGTLDARIDLPAVIGRWASGRGLAGFCDE